MVCRCCGSAIQAGQVCPTDGTVAEVAAKAPESEKDWQDDQKTVPVGNFGAETKAKPAKAPKK